MHLDIRKQLNRARNPVAFTIVVPRRLHVLQVRKTVALPGAKLYFDRVRVSLNFLPSQVAVAAGALGEQDVSPLHCVRTAVIGKVLILNRAVDQSLNEIGLGALSQSRRLGQFRFAGVCFVRQLNGLAHGLIQQRLMRIGRANNWAAAALPNNLCPARKSAYRGRRRRRKLAQNTSTGNSGEECSSHTIKITNKSRILLHLYILAEWQRSQRHLHPP